MTKKLKWGIIYAVAILMIHALLLVYVPREDITLLFSLLFALFLSLVTFFCMYMGYPRPRSKYFWIELSLSLPLYFCSTYFLIKI